jgi:class 3 adenylate cyclase
MEPHLLAVVEAMRGEAFETWLVQGPTRQNDKRMYLPEVALVFSDVVGSTKLLFDLGDDVYDEALRNHFVRARELIARHRGLEVDTAGDGLFCAFRSVADALAYALALWSEPGDPRLTVRAGIHYGMTKFRGSNFCGRTVHFASRVMSQAAGAEVWLSDEAKGYLERSDPPVVIPPLEEFPTCALKNVPGTWRLWRVKCGESRPAEFGGGIKPGAAPKPRRSWWRFW